MIGVCDWCAERKPLRVFQSGLAICRGCSVEEEKWATLTPPPVDPQVAATHRAAARHYAGTDREDV